MFEFNSCSETERTFLTDSLLLSEFQSRVARGYSNVYPDLWIHIDEGSSLIETSDATISRWIGLIRGVGLSLLISNQSAVAISQRVLSNIPNRFIAQCSSFADLNVMASAIGLSSQQKKHFSVNLRPGLLLGSLGQGAWRHPFLFTRPLLENIVPGHQCDNPANRELQSLPVVAAPEFDDWEPEWAKRETIRSKGQTAASVQTAGTGATSQSGVELEANELRLLQAIASAPCKPVFVLSS